MEEKIQELPEISDRMMTAVKMVSRGSRLADIGCDHGYVSIYLYKTGIAKCCIAADVNEGPLKGAARNIALYNADDGVQTRLSDGLKAIEPGEVDSILIMGMGGGLIERILQEGKEVVLSAKEVIAAPQSDAGKTRQCLCEFGFHIEREDFVSECGKYYPVIKAVRSEKKQELSLAQCKYGPVLIEGDHPLFWEFIEKEKNRFSSILEGLIKKEAAPERRDEIRQELKLIEEMQAHKDSREKKSIEMNMEIILASGSPRRKELLEQIGIQPVIRPSGADEETEETRPDRYVEELSKRKCFDIASKTENGIVLGADTVVAKDHVILGKPKDRDDAFSMLKMLQNDVHQVYTGVTLCKVKEGNIVSSRSFSERTDVFVEEMTSEEIAAYVATGEPMDKAGAYGIQGSFAKHIGSIRGDYFNVVGLPLAAVYRQIKEL